MSIAVTQTPGEDHQLNLMGKTGQEGNNNNSDKENHLGF